MSKLADSLNDREIWPQWVPDTQEVLLTNNEGDEIDPPDEIVRLWMDVHPEGTLDGYAICAEDSAGNTAYFKETYEKSYWV